MAEYPTKCIHRWEGPETCPKCHGLYQRDRIAELEAENEAPAPSRAEMLEREHAKAAVVDREQFPAGRTWDEWWAAHRAVEQHGQDGGEVG